MKPILYKTTLLITTLILAFSANAHADEPATPANTAEPGVVEKTEKAIIHGAEATAEGIERGAKATVHGIEHTVKAVERGIERGVKATARGVERGAEATRKAAQGVAEKVGGDEGAQGEHTAEPNSPPDVDTGENAK